MFHPRKLRSWTIALALAGLTLTASSRPAAALVTLPTSNIDWAYVSTTSSIRFHLRFANPDANPTGGGVGTLVPQSYGVFLPDLGPTRNFDIPSIAPGGFFDLFLDYPLALLPASAPTSDTPPVGTPCAPPAGWNGNVHVTWNTAGSNGQAFRHMGRLLVCPGAACSFIHLDTGCAAAAPWTISGLSPGFHASLFEEDRLTPAPNPVPPAWHGWLCIRADAVVPVPTTSCLALQFDCAGQPGVVELCATTCDCNPTGGNGPVPGTIEWSRVQGSGNVRFHVRWDNPNANAPTQPVSGDMMSQAFGVFLPDAGPIGHFDIPTIPAGSFFDVFFDVPMASLPAEPARQFPDGNPPVGGPCPQDSSWNGNVDIVWGGPGGSGTVNRHYGNILVNSAGGGSLLHVISGCTLATGSTWSLSGVCPGWTVTLENEDHSPAPALLPAGWTGWLRLSAPGLPVGSTCCVVLTVQCGSQFAQIRVCGTVCAWATLGVTPSAAPELAFGIRLLSPNPSTGHANVSFVLSLTGAARVEVFDAAGKRVRTLTDAIFAPGVHSIAWDGLDERGNRSRPGAYFVRIAAGGRTASRLLLLRP